MHCRLLVRLGIASVGVLFLLPAIAGAQGTISGLVADASGGVLPGVVIEAASPVLIEGTASATSDGSGRYTIVNLRPGAYTVSFSLEGFSKLVREGVVLVGDATVQVNAAMMIGTVEQSVTVTGESPLVDTQAVRAQFVATREMLDVLPGANSFAGRALLIPGVRNTGMGEGQYWPAMHGSTWRDAQTTNDGMRSNVVIDDGQWQMGWEMNQAATAELAYEAAGASAEVQTGGVVQNAIPKEGGNTFAGTFLGTFGHERLASSNADKAQRLALGEVNRLAHNYDYNPGFGGPIKRNKLWFFSSFRRREAKTFAAGSYFTGEGTPEQRQKNGFPAAGEQGYNWNFANSAVVRLTNQLTEKHKWRFGFERIITAQPINDTDRTRPPESANRIPQPLGWQANGRWNATLTNKLLVEAGFSTQYNKWRREQFEWNEGKKSAYQNLADGTWSGAFWITGHQPERSSYFKSSVTYVTGSHNFKAGLENRWGHLGLDQGPIFGDVRTYFHFNGAPIALMVLGTPLGNFRGDINFDTGIYAQDKWTVGNWTLNLGLRVDLFKSGVPAQSAPAGAWVPAREFPAFPAARWNTIVPRVGVAYDVFGDGRTAWKATFHKYVSQESTTLAMARNPMSSFTWSARQESRSWNDLDGNGSAVAANGRIQYEEVGPSPNQNFATIRDAARLDLDRRPGHWEFNTSIQHELFTRISVGFGYYRRDYHNIWYEDNVAQDYSDYTPFSITGPTDAKLRDFSGQSIPLFNLNQNVFGKVDRLVKTGTALNRLYNGVEWTIQGRLNNGAFFGGSVTTERTFENTCDVDNRNLTLWCDYPRPFLTMFKAHGMYPLPGGILASAFLQGYPGPDISANFNITSAIAGQQLNTPGGTIAIDLLPPEVYFLPYQRKVDLRFMRRFQQGRVRIAPLVDIFNLLNANTVTAVNQTCCSSRYMDITGIMQARFARFGVELDW